MDSNTDKIVPFNFAMTVTRIFDDRSRCSVLETAVHVVLGLSNDTVCRCMLTSGVSRLILSRSDPVIKWRRSSRCSLTKHHRTEFDANVINGPTMMSQASSRNMRKLSLITDYSARTRRNRRELNREMQFYPVSSHSYYLLINVAREKQARIDINNFNK